MQRTVTATDPRPHAVTAAGPAAAVSVLPEQKPAAAPQPGPENSKISRAELRTLLGRGLHFLGELVAVDPKMAWARAGSMALNNAVTYGAFFAFGKVIQHLRPGAQDDLLKWGVAAAVLAVVERTFASKLEKQVESRHELVIDKLITRRVLEAVSRIPVELTESRAVANKVVEIRRSEFDIKGLAKSGFAFFQSVGTSSIAVAILATQLSVSQNAWFAGALFAAAVVIVPGMNLLRSAYQQAQLRTEVARSLTESDKRNNYWRQRLLDPAGAAAFSLAGKTDEVIEAFMENYSKILDSRYKTDSHNRKSQTRADFLSDLPVVGGFLFLMRYVGVLQSSISGFVFLASTLTKARLGFKDIGEKLGEVSERLRVVSTLYDLEELGHANAEKRQRIAFVTPPDAQIKDLEFTYANTLKPALTIPELCIPAGFRVVVVGDNGGGKTTLIKLLTGVYKPTKGSIKIGGYDTQSWLPLVSQIAQDERDFAGFTVRQAIELRVVGTPELDWDEVATRTGVDQIMAKKKFGFDTRVNASFSDGAGFSGGEQQLITLMASILSGTKLKTRDEAMSALSPPKELELTNYLEEERGNVTTIDITHRLGSARSADLILVVENGKISATGTHEELMAQEGWYRTNFLRQSEIYTNGAAEASRSAQTPTLAQQTFGAAASAIKGNGPSSLPGTT